jgi:hypothetical protein
MIGIVAAGGEAYIALVRLFNARKQMSSRAIGCGIFSIILFGWLSSASADIPSTQPAGPKEVFKEYLFDLTHGDSEALPGLCEAKTDDSGALVRDFQAIATAIGHLRAASAKKFGPDSVEMVMPQMASPDSVDGMTETDQPDGALLSGPEAGSVQMVKSDGRWKLNIDWLRQSPEFSGSGDFLKKLAPVIQRTADDINDGRLNSPQAAVEALQAREAGIPDSSPTTQPTTQP